jgi:hypothetical protein
MTNQMYVLRIWHDQNQWRATLTDSVTLEKQHFSSLESLMKVIANAGHDWQNPVLKLKSNNGFG